MALDESNNGTSGVATTNVSRLTTSSNGDGIRSRSYSNSSRIIRSAVRTLQQHQYQPTYSSSQDVLTRQTDSMPPVIPAAPCTTAAIIPAVRKLSKFSISDSYNNFPCDTVSATLPFSHEPKMMRLDDDYFSTQKQPNRFESAQRVRVKSSSGSNLSGAGVSDNGEVFSDSTSNIKFACETTMSATTTSVMSVGHHYRQTSASFFSKSSFSTTCSTNSNVANTLSCQLHATAMPVEFRGACTNFNNERNLSQRGNFTDQPLIIAPHDALLSTANDINSAACGSQNVSSRFASTCTTNCCGRMTDGTSTAPSVDTVDRTLLLPSMTTTQLSNSSSGVSLSSNTRHGSDLSRSTIGGDTNNADLDDLLDIIQRDASIDMVDEHDDRAKKLCCDRLSHDSSSASSGLSMTPGFMSLEASAVADVFFTGYEKRDGYEPANNSSLSNVSGTPTASFTDTFRPCWRPRTPTLNEEEETMLAELQPADLQPKTSLTAISESVECAAKSAEQHSLQVESSGGTISVGDGARDPSVANLDNDLIASASVDCMQMMSDNDLMRMWIQSLPPPHELPEPTLSPRLPLMLPAAAHLMNVTINNIPGTNTVDNVHVCNHNRSSRRRYTLVLDLDETLVHAVTQPLADVSAAPDLTFPIEIVDPAYATVLQASPLLVKSSAADFTTIAAMTIRATIMVYVRPYAVEFLRQMSRHYEVVVFTASKSEYADRVIDYLCDQASLVNKNRKKSGEVDDDDADDSDDADSTSSSAATASPRSAASSGYASIDSLNSSMNGSKHQALTVSGGVADGNHHHNIFSDDTMATGLDEIDCAGLRCTESVLVDDLSPMPASSTCASSTNSDVAGAALSGMSGIVRPPHEQNEQCVVRHRLYREHCVLMPYCPIYLKDLSRLGREIERTVIVDNQLLNFALQLDNGIAVRSWHGSPGHDSELKELATFLTQMAEQNVDDVRPYIKRSFGHLKP